MNQSTKENIQKVIKIIIHKGDHLEADHEIAEIFKQDQGVVEYFCKLIKEYNKRGYKNIESEHGNFQEWVMSEIRAGEIFSSWPLMLHGVVVRLHDERCSKCGKNKE